MTLFARPSDAELLARVAQHKAAVNQPAQSRRCEFCKHDFPPTLEACPHCFREPLEKSEQAEVVKLYRAYGCHVYNLSQARATKQTPGLPDLYVVRGAHVWWHETKRPISGKPSSAQQVFGEECHAANVGWVLGGLSVARWKLVNIGAANWTENGELEPNKQ